MLLPFESGLTITKRCDPEMAILADRHYTRQTIGAREFMGNGKPLVLRDQSGLIVFGWLHNNAGLRLDRQQGYCCVIFRNESGRKSSDIILEAEQLVFREWGRARLFTYVDPRKIGSVNPGYCFKCAGWQTVYDINPTTGEKTIHIAKGKHLLAKAA